MPDAGVLAEVAATRASAADAWLRTASGSRAPLEVRRWLGPASPADLRLLDRVDGPVLDVGCGPGRMLVALGERGVPAMGLDPAPGAVALARSQGACVLQRSVFEPLPGEGRWGGALLLDGSVGIGGDPARLLSRLVELVRGGGAVLVEVEPPGTRAAVDHVRVETATGAGPWFAWARVTVDDLPDVAGRVGLRTALRWREDGRWFADLRRR